MVNHILWQGVGQGLPPSSRRPSESTRILRYIRYILICLVATTLTLVITEVLERTLKFSSSLVDKWDISSELESEVTVVINGSGRCSTGELVYVVYLFPAATFFTIIALGVFVRTVAAISKQRRDAHFAASGEGAQHISSVQLTAKLALVMCLGFFFEDLLNVGIHLVHIWMSYENYTVIDIIQKGFVVGIVLGSALYLLHFFIWKKRQQVATQLGELISIVGSKLKVASWNKSEVKREEQHALLPK